MMMQAQCKAVQSLAIPSLGVPDVIITHEFLKPASIEIGSFASINFLTLNVNLLASSSLYYMVAIIWSHVRRLLQSTVYDQL